MGGKRNVDSEGGDAIQIGLQEKERCAVVELKWGGWTWGAATTPYLHWHTSKARATRWWPGGQVAGGWW